MKYALYAKNQEGKYECYGQYRSLANARYFRTLFKKAGLTCLQIYRLVDTMPVA